MRIELVEEVTANSGRASEPVDTQKKVPLRLNGIRETAFGSPRDFLDNRFVYAVVSARAHGLSVGVNINPDKACNFNCIYCEVHRNGDSPQPLDVDLMAGELRKTLLLVRAGRLRERPWYRSLPDELLQLRHVALSGDGEPTLAPKFPEALQAIMHVRALGGFPFFKLVLITNATGLDLPHVQEGLKHLTRSDEVWAKLDGGSQAYLNKVNQADVPLEKVLANILMLGRQRSIVIQSLFPAIGEEEPSLEEIEQYAKRLLELKKEGADISLVQIYSATRPSANSRCSHLPLRTLSRIAHSVRQITGLNAEVF
ncbi:MAG TPA: radical SAM protein [Verrucomicrobiae bacterium]|nr:radical SAM protein [Verrucomicrobiae bacterium]